MRAAIVQPMRQAIRQSIKGQGSPVPSLNLPLTHTLRPSLANSPTTPNFTRATPATVNTSEGLRLVPANAARFEGARLVRNLITASEDMTNGAYGSFGSPTVTATQVVFGGTANSNVSQSVTITDDGSGAGGRTFVYSAYLRLDSGTISGNEALKIKIGGNAITAAEVSIGSSVDGTLRRFSVTASTDAAGTVVTPFVESDDAITLEITNWMLEERTGMS